MKTTIDPKTINITDLPQPPEGAKFSLVKVDTVSLPHPYCITPQHVEWAADRYGGMLTTDAIREAEERGGACCDICRKSGRILSVDEHENNVTLFILVPKKISNLNDVEGLHSYLLNNKERFVEMGIQGFAFPSS